MKKYLLWLSCAMFGFTFTQCIHGYGDRDKEYPKGEFEGYRPVYENEASNVISIKKPQKLTKPGKIYVYLQYLLVNELAKGIHVFDNSDPAAPIPLYFIQIPGNTDMSLKDNVLYVNNYADLVVLSLTNNGEMDVKKRLPNTFPLKSQNYPPHSGYYECVVESKGKVIGWEKTIIKDPKCD